MTRWLSALLVLCSTAALAQNPGIITQGAVTPGDLAVFVNRNMVKDGGPVSSATSFATPTAIISSVAVPGVLTTATRSDAAPAFGTGSDWIMSGQWTFAAGALTLSKPITITQTWNNAAISFTGFLVNITKSAQSGSSNLADFQFGGVSKFTLDNNGSAIIAGAASFAGGLTTMSAGGNLHFGTGTQLDWPAGTALAGTSANVLSFGGYAADTTGANQTVQAIGVTVGGTGNQAGGNLTVAAGQGKGSVTGTQLALQVPVAGVSGTTLQTMTSGLTIGNTSGFIAGTIWGIDAVTGIAYSVGGTTGGVMTGGSSITTSRVFINNGVNLYQSGIIGFTGGNNANATLVTAFTSGGTATLQLGLANTDTTGVSQSLQSQGVTTGGTNNQAGGSLTISSGQGKGNVGSSLTFQTPIISASGNTLQTMTTAFKLDGRQHASYGGSKPTVSACGTGSPSIDANATDSSGTVTVGTVATGCTITFANAYTSYNHCTISSQTTVSGLAYTYNLSAITLSASVLGGDLIDYRCDGV